MMIKKTLSILICLFILLNTAFVSFAAQRGVDAKMLYSEDFSTWNEVTNDTSVFSISDFEPGSEATRYLKIKNTGAGAFTYTLKAICDNNESLSEVIEVYAKTNVSGNTPISDMTYLGTLSDVLNSINISEGQILPTGEANENFYNEETSIAITLKMKSDADSSYMNKNSGEFKFQLTVNECEYAYTPVDKFEIKFENTDKYLYRVGNENPVPLGSLFKAIEGAKIGNVTAEVVSLDSETTVSGEFSPNIDWTKATIQFKSSGPVEVKIYDDDYSKVCSLKLEVINAINLTSAAHVKTSDAVLLNDCGFSSIDIANGYTLYGNGFTMTCSNDAVAIDMGYYFVSLNNGNLDNVRIICPNFSHSILYDKNKTENGNPSNTDSTGRTRYNNIRSAVKMDGNSRITNSYISGGRAAVYATSGNPVIENSTICGGAVANIHLTLINGLTLKDSTFIQKPIAANVNTIGNTLMGMSIVAMCDDTGVAAPITIKGDLIQYAWVNEDYKSYVPSAGQSIVSDALKQKDFIHQITYANGSTKDSLNLGIVYVPESITALAKEPVNLNDSERTNKAAVPYSLCNLSGAYIYSYTNANGTDDSFKTEPVYTSSNQGGSLPSLTYSETADYLTFETSYDSASGWGSKLSVDLDKIGTYSFDFSKLIATKHNKAINYTVKTADGATVNKSDPIVLSASGENKYVLEITDNIYYDNNGNASTTRSESVKFNLSLVAKQTSINGPELISSNYTVDPVYCVVKGKNSDWTAAAPASLSGIKIKYWSVAESAYKTITLSDYMPTTIGKQNGTDKTWTYSPANGDFTLTLTGSQVKSNPVVYTMPVVVKVNNVNKMYFVMSSTDAYVSTNTTSRDLTISYVFKDKNDKSISFSNKITATYANIKSTQYKYSEFINGSLSEATSSGFGCLAEGTLITLADGTKKPIENVTYNDILLVRDFYTGEYSTSPACLIMDDGKKDYTVITLSFDDGNKIRLIDVHGLYDADLNKYVYIDPNNAESYIEHNFIKPILSEDGSYINSTVKLTGYEVTKEYTGCYTIQTASNVNCIANDMLTQTPPLTEGYFDYFEFGEGVKYDSEKMQTDIEKYGLYSYEDFAEYLDYDTFMAFNGPYLKVAVEKGYFTLEYLFEQIMKFGINSNNSNINTTADNGIVTTLIITSGINNVTSASFGIEVTSDNATATENGFKINAKEAVFKLASTGEASKGYAKITLDGETYYSETINKGSYTEITVKNAVGMEISFAPFWGDSGKETVLVINAGEFTIETEATENGITVIFTNTTKTSVIGDIYVAVYNNTTNTLSGVNVERNITIDGKGSHTFSSEFALPENYSVKVFIWNGMAPVKLP